MHKRIIFLARIFAAIGTLALIGFAYATISEIRFLNHAVATEGRVAGPPDRATDQPIYLYEFPAGTVRRGRLFGGSTSDLFMGGDRIPLYVDARDPGSSQVRRFDRQWLSPISFGAFAAAFGGVGFGILAYSRRRRDWERRIRDRGVRIRADIVGVVSDNDIVINGRFPWRIQAQALIDGKIHPFASADLWFDPSPFLDRQQVDVLYLEEDPRRHWMDVSFLPEYVMG